MFPLYTDLPVQHTGYQLLATTLTSTLELVYRQYTMQVQSLYMVLFKDRNCTAFDFNSSRLQFLVNVMKNGAFSYLLQPCWIHVKPCCLSYKLHGVFISLILKELST